MFSSLGKVYRGLLRNKKISKKIFCISFQRTGTTSVGEFFRTFGYASRGWPECDKNNWGQLWYDGDYESIFCSADFLSGQVFEDSPWWLPEFYKVLFYRFPGSQFILLTRDPDKWFASMLSHSSGKIIGNEKRHCKVYRRELEFYSLLESNSNSFSSENRDPKQMLLNENEKHYKEIYKLHNREVVDFFERVSPNSLFTCRLEDPYKWQKLGHFFGINVLPDFEVHRNKSKVPEQPPPKILL